LIYWDSSAFVKKYLREEGSDAVVRRLDDDPAVASSILSYAEIHAVFSRKARERGISAAALERLRRSFDSDWKSLVVVRVYDMILPSVREVLSRHPLRGADAVHLASALYLARQTRVTGLSFACADDRLLKAAAAEGLTAWNPLAD
jgi:predicted nucleic acid-binding protein